MRERRAPARILGLSVAAMLNVTAGAAFADSLEWFDTPSGRDATWHFSVGAGASIPLEDTMTVPLHVYTSPNPNFPYQVVFPELKGKLRKATTFEGRLTRRLTSFMEAGILGGSSTEHRRAFPEFEADYTFPGIGTFTLPSAANFAVKVSKVVPLITVGRWVDVGRLQFRPYLVAGGGWYYVDVQLWGATNQSVVWSEEHQYSGAVGGAGLSFGLGERGALTLEARYERIFSPDRKLKFFVPAVHLGYLF